METINIIETRSTPAIWYEQENRKLSIKGESYPENAFEFFEPVFKWVDQYIEMMSEGSKFTIEFSLPYINTSSSKCIILLLDKFEDAYQVQKNVKLIWYYDPENESELEVAEEFKEDFNFPFHIREQL